ncbi:MAG: AI-2E family transporter [Crocinitomicaceae bacterium]|nr:AI-2E family transporter [Crocinitomicaceae bacterium]
MEKVSNSFLVRLALTLFSLIALSSILVAGKYIIAPFFLAFLLAILFLPFVQFLERKLWFGRALSTLSAMAVMLILIALFIFFFGSQLADFNQDLPRLQEQSTIMFSQFQQWIDTTFHVNSKKQFEYIDLGLSKLLSSSVQILSVTFNVLASSLAFLVFFSFFFIFVLNYRKILVSFLFHVFSEEHKSTVNNVVNEVKQMTKSYMLGLGIQIILVFFLTVIALSIIGVKYAVLLSILTAILNIVPYIGILVSMVLTALIALMPGVPIDCLYVLIAYAIIHLIDANMILPFVVGSKVKINALVTFLGLLIGESLWGISGMLLSIPALAILKIIINNIDSLKPWGILLGENVKAGRKKRKIRITKKIVIEEKD